MEEYIEFKCGAPAHYRVFLEFYGNKEVVIYKNEKGVSKKVENRAGSSACDITNTALECLSMLKQKKKTVVDLDIKKRPVFSLRPFMEWMRNIEVQGYFIEKYKRIRELMVNDVSNDPLLFLSILDNVPSKYLAYSNGIDNVNSELGIGYSCNNILDFVNASFDYLVSHDLKINICANCGRLFIPQKKINEKYCHNQSPQYSNKDCQEAARLILQKEREKKDAIVSEYKKVYNRLRQRYAKCMDARKAQVYQEELNAFLNQAQEKKDLIKEGKYTREEFMEWLKSFKERKN